MLDKGKSDVTVKYFRRDWNSSGGEYMCFKEPKNEDIYATEITDIVKILHNPTFMNHKIIVEASEMSNLLVR